VVQGECGVGILFRRSFKVIGGRLRVGGRCGSRSLAVWKASVSACRRCWGVDRRVSVGLSSPSSSLKRYAELRTITSPPLPAALPSASARDTHGSRTETIPGALELRPGALEFRPRVSGFQLGALELRAAALHFYLRHWSFDWNRYDFNLRRCGFSTGNWSFDRPLAK